MIVPSLLEFISDDRISDKEEVVVLTVLQIISRNSGIFWVPMPEFLQY
jgi:hypothetical protein